MKHSLAIVLLIGASATANVNAMDSDSPPRSPSPEYLEWSEDVYGQPDEDGISYIEYQINHRDPVSRTAEQHSNHATSPERNAKINAILDEIRVIEQEGQRKQPERNAKINAILDSIKATEQAAREKAQRKND